MKFKYPKKLLLANLPTPIHLVSFEGRKFLMKRDDFTGVELSGNKVRKLEYLLYQAKKEKANYIFTCGGEQSNHSRATAIAAASYGMKSKLFLWGKEKKYHDGNLFLDNVIGAEIKFLSKEEYSNVNALMNEEKEKYEKQRKKVFIVPEGGSSPLGIVGYIEFMNELSRQISKNNLNGILIACGSGGTAAGLLIGSYLHNFDIKIYVVNVLYPSAPIRERILNLAYSAISKMNLKIKLNEKSLEVLEGYSLEGYKKISNDKLDLIKRFAKSTGIILDPTYTGKAFKAFYENFLNKNTISKTMFVHTGGIFGVFSKRKEYLNA